MSPESRTKALQIKQFIEELSGFAASAEEVLGQIEADMEANRGKFDIFARMMLTIRGTAQQLGFPRVAEIARLGEEIAVKAVTAESRPQIRKCIGSLWDVLTTVKHLIVHRDAETGEEQAILLNRLENTLNAFGGTRPKVDSDEIARLLADRG